MLKSIVASSKCAASLSSPLLPSTARHHEAYPSSSAVKQEPTTHQSPAREGVRWLRQRPVAAALHSLASPRPVTITPVADPQRQRRGDLPADVPRPTASASAIVAIPEPRNPLDDAFLLPAMPKLPFLGSVYGMTARGRIDEREGIRQDHEKRFLGIEDDSRIALEAIPTPQSRRDARLLRYSPWQLRHAVRTLLRRDNKILLERQFEALSEEVMASIIVDVSLPWKRKAENIGKTLYRRHIINETHENLVSENSALG